MELAGEVDRYLRQTGMSATRFGRIVACDPNLVADLRAGRQPQARLRARILTQIGRPQSLSPEFARALAELAQPHGFSVAAEMEASPWASSGFVGEQLRCTLLREAGAEPGWPSRLPDHPWSLPFLVADIAVTPCEGGLQVTALLMPET